MGDRQHIVHYRLPSTRSKVSRKSLVAKSKSGRQSVFGCSKSVKVDCSKSKYLKSQVDSDLDTPLTITSLMSTRFSSLHVQLGHIQLIRPQDIDSCVGNPKTVRIQEGERPHEGNAHAVALLYGGQPDKHVCYQCQSFQRSSVMNTSLIVSPHWKIQKTNETRAFIYKV